MALKIRERVQAHVVRPSEASDAPLELTIYRFMGVLLHPVPLSEMLHRCEVNHRGCRIVAAWPATASEAHPIKVGDVLQIEERRYPIRAVTEHPGCYLELYIDEP
jgi:hypothetical protein